MFGLPTFILAYYAISAVCAAAVGIYIFRHF